MCKTIKIFKMKELDCKKDQQMNICTWVSASLVLLKLEVISSLHSNFSIKKFCGIFRMIAGIKLWHPSKTHYLPKQSATKNVFYSCLMTYCSYFIVVIVLKINGSAIKIFENLVTMWKHVLVVRFEAKTMKWKLSGNHVSSSWWSVEFC